MSHSDDPRRGKGKHRNNGNKFRLLHVSAAKSMMKAMKGSRAVQKKIVEGDLDRHLPPKPVDHDEGS